jgi:hypothetical protein
MGIINVLLAAPDEINLAVAPLVNIANNAFNSAKRARCNLISRPIIRRSFTYYCKYHMIRRLVWTARGKPILIKSNNMVW